MTFHKTFILGFFLIPTFIFAQTESQKLALKKMIETEKAFAQTSLDKGTKNAFLEFLGKDSMLYKQNINFAQYEELGKLVYGALKSFCAGKKAGDQIFETVDPPILNKHLTSLMSGLSAKVFRTFNASITLEKELPDAASMSGLSLQEKLNLYNTANRQVAILCNHQRTVSKAAETMFENLNEKLTTMKDQTGQLIEYVRVLRMYANCVLTLENSFFELIALVLL